MATKKVTGIGGIFVKCDDPKKMQEWYGSHLGLEITEYGGAIFEFKTADTPSKTITSVWSTFPRNTKNFEKEYMVNFRVENIDSLVEELKKNKVTVLDEVANYGEYGKFVHILDPEGNKLELWEPPVE
jgi:lactoylglutathione lyase